MYAVSTLRWNCSTCGDWKKKENSIFSFSKIRYIFLKFLLLINSQMYRYCVYMTKLDIWIQWKLHNVDLKMSCFNSNSTMEKQSVTRGKSYRCNWKNYSDNKFYRISCEFDKRRLIQTKEFMVTFPSRKKETIVVQFRSQKFFIEKLWNKKSQQIGSSAQVY